MERIYLTVFADLTKEAPAGAGWYVQVTSDEGMHYAPTLVAEGTVPPIALAIEHATGDDMRIAGVVTGINSRIRNALKEQLEHAEQVAAQIPLLRERLGVDYVDSVPKQIVHQDSTPLPPPVH